MVVVWLVQLWGFVFGNTLGALPTSPTLGLNAKAGAFVGTGLFDGAGWLNAYLPIDAVMDGLGVVLGVFVVMWVIRLVIYVLSKLHVLGGGDE